MSIELYHGDCLEVTKDIPNGSVDLILTDPPYGTVKNAPKNWTVGNKASHGWDKAVNPEDLFGVANRILRRNGKLVLFSQEPYTSRLITEAHPNIPFSYRMIWEKNDFANALLVNKAPVSYYEDVLVFSKHPESERNDDNPIKLYADKVFDYVNVSTRELKNKYGKDLFSHFKSAGKQFRLCTRQSYDLLIEDYNLKKMKDFVEWEVLKKMDGDYKEKFPSTFNLPEGKKYKSNILKYKKDYDGYHPTQKPILLLEDLIKTFSNEGDTVVDLTMGSGSTGVACVNTNRNFIGMELDEGYFNIATNRIKNHKVADD